MRSRPNSNSVWSSHQPSVVSGSSWATSMNMATRCGIRPAMLSSAAAVSSSDVYDYGWGHIQHDFLMPFLPDGIGAAEWVMEAQSEG